VDPKPVGPVITRAQRPENPRQAASVGNRGAASGASKQTEHVRAADLQEVMMSASTMLARVDSRLAVRPIDCGEPQRIVVGLDDTPTARAALRWAARQARLTGATVRAVHVIDWPIGIEAFGSVEVGEDGRLQEERVSGPYRRGIHRVFEEASPEPGWQLQFAEGDAAPVLVAEAADADLLVIGTRTNPDWAGDVSGPIAHHCLSRTTCPVVVVPLEESRRAQGQ
jgi:nucleotide-binding universal stress UspA family protein